MKLQKFFKENIFRDNPLEYYDFEKQLVLEKLNMLSRFYEELDDLFDELDGTTHYKKQNMYFMLIGQQIDKANRLISYLNIDDILFTTNRTKINGAKLLIKKSNDYRMGKISRDNYSFFIHYMNRFYTLCYLIISGTYSYNCEFKDSKEFKF